MQCLIRSPELACRIPNRIVSLSLTVTRAGGTLWANMPSVCAHTRCIFAKMNGRRVADDRISAFCEVISLDFNVCSSDALSQSAHRI